MAHFAELDATNIVLRVIVVPNEHEAGGAGKAGIIVINYTPSLGGGPKFRAYIFG